MGVQDLPVKARKNQYCQLPDRERAFPATSKIDHLSLKPQFEAWSQKDQREVRKQALCLQEVTSLAQTLF